METKTKEVAKRNNVIPADLSNISHKAMMFRYSKDQFVASLGVKDKDSAETIFNTEVGFALQMLEKNTYLKGLDKRSLVTAIVNVALTGLSLNPELKLGYLVPRKGKIYFQSSYMGKREILLRAGIVQDIWVNLVYEKDEFVIMDGTERKITHVPNHFAEDRGPLKGGYWAAKLKNGTTSFGVMPLSNILKIKAMSEAVKAKKKSPWDDFESEMMKKTILNWGFKDLPKTGISDNVLKAMEAQDKVENEDMSDWIKEQEDKTVHDFDTDKPSEDKVINIEDAQIVEEKKEEVHPMNVQQGGERE